MSGKIAKFQEEHPSLESYWRSIVLFGNNVASYKFALAKPCLKSHLRENLPSAWKNWPPRTRSICASICGTRPSR